ncbi:MAG: sugar phosphate isomerase/epimerase [Ruminococcus sp.]|nr:sugar phosphate isomerase/epimerase [Ruminococcus sp.]MCD7800527.1 sugar phosphate isomerase/epimerase [Ruminococcus sp.]
MKAGVSSACLYPQILERAVEDIAKCGIKATEIFINTDCELEEFYVRELRAILDYYGTECISVHPYTCSIEPMMFFSNYERRVNDALRYYSKFFKAMNILGANIFVFHGNKETLSVEESLYFDRFFKLSEVGKQYNIIVAQENVARCQCNNIPFMVNMVNQLGDVAKFVIDLKQAIRNNVELFDIINSVGKNIAHIHISDHTSTHDCLPLGMGILDVKLLLKRLKEVSFNGAIMLELYRNNFDTIEQLHENYLYLCKEIDNFN